MQETLEKVRENKIKFIELQFTDIFGTLKSIEIPADCLKEAIEKGVWFDGSSIEGFARLKESDMYLKPDLSTYAILPDENGDKKTARFICDIYNPSGTLYEKDPRAILKKVIKEAEQLGYKFYVGPEVEFHLLKRKETGELVIPHYDTGSYFDCSAGNITNAVRKEIMNNLKNFGITSERAHHEVGAGQHELGFKYGDALTTADRVITLKKIIKTIANKYGLVATFMPKPFYKKAGNGMHVHFSVFDKDNKPLFYDTSDKNHLSEFAKHFIAGQLKHIKEMCAITNPTTSSYKRLVSGYEAPVYICWGERNRSTLIRIPRYSEGRESSARGELRNPDPSSNPYLLFAAMLKAGIEGVKQKLELMPITEDSVFEKTKDELKTMNIEILPGNLGHAVEHLKKSSIMKDMMGEELHKEYANAKEKEAEEYRVQVTEWEVKRYIESC